MLSFALPGTQTGTVSLPANNGYAAEEVILNAGDLSANELDAQTSDGQVLTALYETEDAER